MKGVVVVKRGNGLPISKFNKKLKRLYLGLGFIVLCLMIWELVARSGIVNQLSFPLFSEVAKTWWQMASKGIFFHIVGSTLRRMFIGFAFAVLAGITFGILMGYFKFFHDLLEPTIEFLRPLPSPAYIPILILFLGIDDELKIAVVAIGAFFPILINTHSGIRNIEPTYLDTAKTLGIPLRATVLKVVLPAALPYVFSGLRVSLGIALILAVLSEMVAGNSGIGFYILQAQRTFRVAEMFATVITTGIVGYLLNTLFLLLERVAVGWSSAYQREL